MQEGKSALNSGRLKSEVDAHKETREKLDKLLTETRAENEKIRSEYSEFIKKLKEEEKRQKFAEQEQSVKVPFIYYVSTSRGRGFRKWQCPLIITTYINYAYILHRGWGKEFFRTCNVLPFSYTHLALWRGKRPKVHVKHKGFKNFFRLWGGRGSEKPKKVLT